MADICLPPSDIIARWLSAVRLTPDIAQRRQTLLGGRWYSNVAECYIAPDGYVEMEIRVADTGKEICLQATDQIREMYRDLLSVSVAVEEVRQLKIAIQPSPEALKLVSSMFMP